MAFLVVALAIRVAMAILAVSRATIVPAMATLVVANASRASVAIVAMAALAKVGSLAIAMAMTP